MTRPTTMTSIAPCEFKCPVSPELLGELRRHLVRGYGDCSGPVKLLDVKRKSRELVTKTSATAGPGQAASFRARGRTPLHTLAYRPCSGFCCTSPPAHPRQQSFYEVLHQIGQLNFHDWAHKIM
jgi:hypothetical protein